MFQRILYPVDIQEGDVCQRSFDAVLEEVRTREAKLYLIYVVPGFGMPLVAAYFPQGTEKKILRDAEAAMAAYVERHVPDDVDVTPIVAEGTPYEQVLEAARSHDIDLIVIPSRDRTGVERWLLGSNASKVVHHADCAVLVLRGPPR